MNVVLSRRIISFRSGNGQNTNNRNNDKLLIQTTHKQDSVKFTNNNSSGSTSLLRAGKFFVGSFAILALLHRKMIMKSNSLACKLALISAGIAAIHGMHRKKYS